MTSIGRSPKRRERMWWLVPLLVLGGVAAPAVPVAGQYEQILTQATLEYDQARLDYQARHLEWDVQNRRWTTTLTEIQVARRAGNRDRESAALDASILQGQELTRLDNRVKAAAAVLEEKRRALENALDLRREALASRWSNATPLERASLEVSIRGLDTEYAELQADRAATLTPRLVFWPTIQREPTDGPVEMRAKLQLLDRELESAVSHREWVETEIRRTQNRIDLNRRAADSRENRNIFDAASPPVGGASRTDAGAEVPLSERPLEAQLEALQENLLQLDLMIEEIRVRAAVFRGLLTTLGGAAGGVP